MATGLSFIKSPYEFVFGDNVELFLARFQAFGEATKEEKSVKRGRSRGKAKPRNLGARVALAGRGRGGGRVAGPALPAVGIGNGECKPALGSKIMGRGRRWGQFQPAEETRDEVPTSQGQARDSLRRTGVKCIGEISQDG